MLVKCPDCKVEFSPSTGVCPSCREWRPSIDDARDFFVDEAVKALSSKETRSDVQQRLIENGFSELDADTIVSEAARKVRTANRALGRSRSVKGLALMCLNGLILLVTGGMLFAYGLLAAGFALFAAGKIQRTTGANVD
jgi:hypothetical protein